MTDAVIANVALLLRVFLVGGFFLLLPRITRRGLLFGVYVGEAQCDGEPARRLLSRWYGGCKTLMVVSLAVGLGISFAGWPVAGNLTGTAVLLLGGLGLYLQAYSGARDLVPPAAERQAAVSAAPLTAGDAKGVGLARLVLGICVVMSVAAFAYALSKYEGPWSGRPFIAIMYVPSMNLVVSPFVALFAMLTATAKRSLRGGTDGQSMEAQDLFRTTMTRLLSWTALLTGTFMTILSVQITRLQLAEIGSLGAEIWWFATLLLVCLLGSLIWLVRRYGQGGALLEQGTVEAPLTNGLADNTRWVWGLFYVDKDDPSVMVEKRFGLGYALNYGNPTAIAIVATLVVLLLSLIALGLFGELVGGT